MAHLAEFQRKTPEKWKRIWNQFFSNNYIMIFTEPLISEIFYQIERKAGKDAARLYLFRLKGKRTMRVVPDKDGDKLAFLAGHIRVKHDRQGISLADSYTIAAAIMEGAVIYTTDHGVRDAARQEKCQVSYLPKEALFQDSN